MDAQVITFERIKEELLAGKSLNNALNLGYKRAFKAILDGNTTIIIVAVILMGAFGPPDSVLATLMSWLYFMFPATIEGTIYSFGYTLLVGVIMNLVFGVLCSKLMLGSIANFKCFSNHKLYGGKNND